MAKHKASEWGERTTSNVLQATGKKLIQTVDEHHKMNVGEFLGRQTQVQHKKHQCTRSLRCRYTQQQTASSGFGPTACTTIFKTSEKHYHITIAVRAGDMFSPCLSWGTMLNLPKQHIHVPVINITITSCPLRGSPYTWAYWQRLLRFIDSSNEQTGRKN